ncbi:zinc-dependent metalloprotease [Ideonella livida]|uniref:DUF5117 domain-containing protein n=1 Tax=Ideonella livida TaxID=2707176 RepID=A0A7C9PKE5_9BURK|nr:zinc-dependent metalloprotease [Ideonella livida]NDY93270.1 DUF5117 domain-containing protein [Ideonella livida]
MSSHLSTGWRALLGVSLLGLPAVPPLAATAPLSAIAAEAAAAPKPAASAPAAATAASGAASAAGGAAPAKPADPSGLKPFVDVVKEARAQNGLLTVWRKEDKTWLEIPADALGKPLLLSTGISQSVGERGLYGSQMGPDWTVEFRRVGNAVQLVALNTQYRAPQDPVAERAVRQGFSQSLLAAMPLVAAPHPERKSLLVEAGFLLGDLVAYGTALETAYRLPFSLDRANSSIEASQSAADHTSLQVRLHFGMPRLPAPPLMPSPAPMPAPPSTLPDPRSLFVGVVYNFKALPTEPMRPRLADPRLGHFTEAFTDLSGDQRPNPRVHYVARWRLEKQDPGAALSPPVQPITFWLDKAIPERYRAAVRDGVLVWNAAFERLGFKDAVVVRQQADDDSFDTLDGQHASVRWFVGADVGFARGPSVVDPRSGEILDADIAMSDVFGRGARRFVVEDVDATTPVAALPVLTGHRHDQHCDHTLRSAAGLGFALDLLQAREGLSPDSPEVEAFVAAVIQSTIAHEVGHTLGLKHNFKGSTVVPAGLLGDFDRLSREGLSNSVMDYLPYHLPLQSEGKRLPLVQTTLGAYDFWAIEYAYRPLAPEAEREALARIAARSTEPALVFADDADVSGPSALDPRASLFDLGDDPLAWAQRRWTLSQELWQRLQSAQAGSGRLDPARARRSLASSFAQLRGLPDQVARHVGGLYTQRQAPGETTLAAYQPVPAARQRAALQWLTTGLFAADSFEFRPDFLAMLGPNTQEWGRAAPVSISDLVLRLQLEGLDRLLAAATAQRLQEQTQYLSPAERRQALGLEEVYAQVQQAVWTELKSGREISPMRRTLQREHVRRLVSLLTRPAPGFPADALSLVRWQTQALVATLKTASAKTGGPVLQRAHLAESLSALTEALRASMSRG